MKAVVHDRYGGPEVLCVEEVERPMPGDDEMLVRVQATTVTRTDCHMRAARPFVWRFMLGLRRPRRRILGIEFAGEVEAVGAAVTEFRVGDQVFGIQPYLRNPASGAHAELICVRERGPVAHKPAGMTFEEAAAVCDGYLQGVASLSTAGVGRGQRLLVYGASGSLGTAAVQLAKHSGVHVTAVCNTKNVEVVRSLGADEVIDYQREDFTKNGRTYDAIVDAVDKHSFLKSRGSLKPGGIFVATDLGRFASNPLLMLATRVRRGKRVKFPSTRYTKEHVLRLKELVEAGAYRAVIDRSYPLEEVVEATRYVETFQKTGNVVLTVGGADS